MGKTFESQSKAKHKGTAGLIHREEKDSNTSHCRRLCSGIHSSEATRKHRLRNPQSAFIQRPLATTTWGPVLSSVLPIRSDYAPQGPLAPSPSGTSFLTLPPACSPHRSHAGPQAAWFACPGQSLLSFISMPAT